MKPRPIEPSTYHHITRRCVARMSLLRPDPDVIQLFTWCFAEGSRRYGVQVHRLTLMGNHYHAVLFDKQGLLPDFLQWVHREIARGIQRIRRIDGSVFDQGKPTGDQILATEQAFWKMMTYVHANPMDAGLVKRPQDWPGTLTPAGVTELHAQRPDWMTAKSGPKHHVLPIATPEHFADPDSPETYHERLGEADRAYVQDLRTAMRAEGRHRFQGRAKAMDRHWRWVPKTKPARGTPRFVAVMADAICAIHKTLKTFWDAYAVALEAFRSGQRDTEFPVGTWKMVHSLRCCVAKDG